jgi:AcrR family transcriptional regulator
MSRGVLQMSNANVTIIEAFLKLLGKKGFDELSVKEIINKAGFSRSTFYLHFVDKFELMEEGKL